MDSSEGESTCSYVEVRATDFGRGLFLTQDAAAGQVLLKEPPLLLYVAEETKSEVCAWCCRMPGPAGKELPTRNTHPQLFPMFIEVMA